MIQLVFAVYVSILFQSDFDLYIFFLSLSLSFKSVRLMHKWICISWDCCKRLASVTKDTYYHYIKILKNAHTIELQ